jgi:hypothetical protein
MKDLNNIQLTELSTCVLGACAALLLGCASPTSENPQSDVEVSVHHSTLSDPFIESNGMVVMEAENFHVRESRGRHSWYTTYDKWASNLRNVLVSPNLGITYDENYVVYSPQLDFHVYFKTIGTFIVWIRGAGETSDDNSCHVGIDGMAVDTAARVTGFRGQLSWSNEMQNIQIATVPITEAGMHTINVWMREDGFRMDKIVLTTDSDFVPGGDGPKESVMAKVGCTTDDECDDGNPCTDNVCSDGICVRSNNTASCDDGDACTENDVCEEGSCSGSPRNCDDLNSCTDDTCVDGVCTHSNNRDRCDDGDACTQNDRCGDGTCTGRAIICDDFNECTADICEGGACVFEAISAPCDDGDGCTVDDVCSEGECVPGTPMVCEDNGNICTDEVCEAGACVSKNNKNSCNDGNFCTVVDVCRDGHCIGLRKRRCDDDNPCTDDSCDDSGCIHTPNTDSCDDGDYCTVGDTCSDGVCVGGGQRDCNDGNICTEDTCIDGQCAYAYLSGTCDDGDACTVEDVCSEGACIGEPMVCADDGNVCTDELCSEGVCISEFNANPCDDGDACTLDDTCTEGVCTAGSLMNCDDGDPCTDDTCEDGICIHIDNGTCVGTDTEPCTPKTYVFRMGLNSYTAVTDIGLKQQYPDTPYPSETTIGVDLEDVYNNETTETQALVKFAEIFGDGEGQIPLSAIVENASVSFYTTNSTTGPVSLHRMLVDWNEASTWNSLIDGVSPDDVEAQTLVDGEIENPAVNQQTSVDVTDTVSSWQNAPGDNYGWVLLNHNTDGWDFRGSEHETETNRPELIVDVCEFGGVEPDGGVDTDTDSETETEPDGGLSCTPGTYTYQLGSNGFTSVVDINIAEQNPDVAYPSADILGVDLEDVYNTPDTETQLLIKFSDLFGNSAGQIAKDATIERAVLSLVTDNGTTNDISVHRMLLPWDESATWNSFDGGVNADDVDAESDPSAIVSAPSVGDVAQFDITSSITIWQSNPELNYGWVVFNDGTDGWDVFASEHDTVSERPKLTIDVVCSNGPFGTDTDTDTDTEPLCEPIFFTFRAGLDGYTDVVDINLSQQEPDSVLNSETTIGVDLEDTHNTSETETQALIRFNNIFGTAAGQIPVDADIVSAELSVTTSNATTNNISLHQMLVDWGPDATWNLTVDGVSADDVESVATPDTTPSSQSVGASSFDVTASVISWQSGTTSNFGWVILNDGVDGWDFDASESSSESKRPTLIVEVCGEVIPPNINPPVPVYPLDGSDGIETNPTLETTVSTLDNAPIDVVFYGRKAGEAPWTLIVLPDTQIYVQNRPEIFKTQTEWIVNNREALNIQMVAHEGDIVNSANSQTQWDNAYDALNLLIEAGMPFTFSPGNHDHSPMTTTGDTTLFSSIFTPELFEPFPWWPEDSSFNNNNNHYVILNIAGEDYVFIGLDFCPDEYEIAWANDVLTAHADKKAVLTTHALLDDDGHYRGGLLCPDTQYIWDDLITNHENLRLVLCGHMHESDGEAYLASYNSAGYLVHQLMANYQTYTNGGDGRLRIMTFDPPNDKIYVQTYSPYTGVYDTGPESSYELDYEMNGGDPYSLLGSVTGVESGNNAALYFGDLESATTYEWYIEVTDGIDLLKGPIWRFTTL